MRIHRLEVSAFGPFSGAESIDFDELGDSGLFLLCGPTGAGKTSILDAVCFALYGEVPGDRGTAKRLRSDHAAPDAGPHVVLEASINARRFRIRRSPAWSRPKRRGTGTTAQPARVLLEERKDGTWVHLSSRLDETGQLLTGLLGMNASQFCQVAMLPQGRFQSFLRARSDERHRVLQQLFRTSRFEEIERWLVARRQTLHNAHRAHQDAVADVVSRLSESAGIALPEDWDPRELAAPAEAGLLSEWADELVESASRRRQSLERAVAAATATVSAAKSALDRAREQDRLRALYAEAAAARLALRESAADAERTRNRLEAARRAQVVAPLLRLVDEAGRSADEADRELSEVLGRAAARLGAAADRLGAEDLAAAEHDAREAAAVARTLLPREAELRKAEAARAAAVTALEALSVRLAELDGRCAALPRRIEEVRTRREERLACATELPALEAADGRLRGSLEAAEKLVGISAQLEAARSELRTSVDLAQSLREVMHEVREARINGMAAELASALAVGGSCPVCGSPEHPAVAEPVPGAPGSSDEQQAREAYEDADFARQARAETVATIERNRALAEQASDGRTVEHILEELRTNDSRRTAAWAAAAEADRLTTELRRVERELGESREQLDEASREAVRLTTERDSSRARVETISDELATLFRDDEVADSIEQLLRARTDAAQAFGTARRAIEQRDLAATRLAEACAHAEAVAAEAGFRKPAAAARAVADPAEMTSWERQLRARDNELGRVDTVMRDAQVLAALESDALDLAATETRAQLADDELAGRLGRLRLVEARASRLVALTQELRAELAAWAPTRAQHSVAQAMSSLAEGKSAENALRMRLSGYVLASRLRQVVAAANERLAAMSDQRYTFEHSETRGAGEQRGGLSLLVRDAWTGESRDPATLSGGETFVASLALALGLADVVTQESGGADVDTLFIDEGFGTLDPETLDDVMNTLDSLREGGRVVGIVSHVPELRTRVTAQIQVRKGRSGSSVLAVREPV